jgi:chromosome segregation ATPase
MTISSRATTPAVTTRRNATKYFYRDIAIVDRSTKQFRTATKRVEKLEEDLGTEKIYATMLEQKVTSTMVEMDDFKKQAKYEESLIQPAYTKLIRDERFHRKTLETKVKDEQDRYEKLRVLHNNTIDKYNRLTNKYNDVIDSKELMLERIRDLEADVESARDMNRQHVQEARNAHARYIIDQRRFHDTIKEHEETIREKRQEIINNINLRVDAQAKAAVLEDQVQQLQQQLAEKQATIDSLFNN